MAQGRILTVHAWDPYHGDRNNRHPRLGAPVPRRVSTDLWRTFTSIQPAIHNNGIYGWTNHLDTVDAMTRRGEQLTQAKRYSSSRALRKAKALHAERLLILHERGAGVEAEQKQIDTRIQDAA